MSLTPKQMRAGRAVVDLGVRELAAAAGLNPFTINRYETGKGDMKSANMAKVRTVLEQAGVSFLPDHGEGPGIRWRVSHGREAGDDPAP